MNITKLLTHKTMLFAMPVFLWKLNANPTTVDSSNVPQSILMKYTLTYNPYQVKNNAIGTGETLRIFTSLILCASSILVSGVMPRLASPK